MVRVGWGGNSAVFRRLSRENTRYRNMQTRDTIEPAIFSYLGGIFTFKQHLKGIAEQSFEAEKLTLCIVFYPSVYIMGSNCHLYYMHQMISLHKYSIHDGTQLDRQRYYTARWFVKVHTGNLQRIKFTKQDNISPSRDQLSHVHNEQHTLYVYYTDCMSYN